ncbi:MAG: Hcp family type VI secretion system effector [Desulfobacterales bacterium]|nr:Hcp family type VI secretion system effector [Desulfobacterales bacterium]MCP4160446.1 Hcp family type VI secretion system effector [Deltaproteobacteria bacterium]
MPMPAHLEITGNNQGAIEGSCEMEGRENTILVHSMDHNIHIPRDPQSGLATGKRVHGPLTILKETDKSTPKLYQALVTGENLSNVLIKWYRIDPTGAEEHYFTHEIEDAIIVEVKPFMPTSFLKENEPYRHMEKISFSYKKITWTWEVDGIASEDSWITPKV